MSDERLTNGLHDELWIKGARALPDIVHNLGALSKATRVGNAIAIAKELYCIGAMSKEDYIKTLKNLLIDTGYELKK